MSKKTKEIIRWEVYDKRKRWMGGYSVRLDELHRTSAFDMAQMNASQCNGKVFSVCEDGELTPIKEI
jgi:hypothetical protein